MVDPNIYSYLKGCIEFPFFLRKEIITHSNITRTVIVSHISTLNEEDIFLKICIVSFSYKNDFNNQIFYLKW